MWQDSFRSIYYIAVKDMKTYYLKPPAVSWGIVFPIAWILAFYLKNPQDFAELVPGLIAMTVLFSTTAVEAVVINLEVRLGSLERLLLAPISLSAVLLGKIIGGVIFGFMMTAVVTVSSVLVFELQVNILHLVLILIPSLFVFSSLGALLCVLVREVFEAQTLLNLPRFLMIFLCGVVYPISAMPPVLKHFAYVLPLTYTVGGVQQSLGSVQSGNIIRDTLVLLAFIPVFIFPAVKLLAKKFA
ncbi:MAG: ABC transporter permease [Dehalococcoidia bacterium]|nr:ABC transporter permease [Dehalococcoidia bacterium]